MYIVRWLMGHPIIAAWFLAAIAILLNFGTGKKNDLTDSEGVKDIIHTENEVVEQVIPGSGLTVPADSVSPNSTDSDISNSVSTTDIVDSLEITNTSYPDGLKANDESEVDKATSTEEHQSASIEQMFPSQDNAESSQKSDATAISDLGQMSAEEMLLMAREAYWNNGLDEASQIYKQLITLEPKVIEHRGELGNVYWRQGYPKKAAELYSEISLPMIEKGESDRVANMIGFIGLFYPDRAAEIHKRLQSETAKSQ